MPSRGAESGDEADADPMHRHAVRLTNVVQTVDPLDDTPIVEVGWSEADALPFPLCLPTVKDGKPLEVAIARGNVLLVDQGLTVGPESLDPVPEDRPFGPRLAQQPVTFAAPFDPATPASAAMRWDVPQPGRPERWCLTGSPSTKDLVQVQGSNGTSGLLSCPLGGSWSGQVSDGVFFLD